MDNQVMPVSGTAIRKEVKKGNITLDKVYKADFQKEGTLSAQIRQIIETKSFYPSKQVSSNMQDNIFSLGAFGFGEQEFTNTETRVAWIDVPTTATAEQVQAMLNQAVDNGACLYRVMSNKPILTNHQEFAVSQGLRTKDEFADSQIVRFPEGHEKAGQISLDINGKVQYRRVFFKATPTEDVDNRTTLPEDQYISAATAAELQGASVLSNQTI